MFKKYNTTIGLVAPVFLVLSILSLSTFLLLDWWMVFSYALFMFCGIGMLLTIPEAVLENENLRIERRFKSKPSAGEKIVQVIHLSCLVLLTLCTLYPFFEKKYEGGLIVGFASIVSLLICLMAVFVVCMYVFYTFKPLTKKDIDYIRQQSEIKEIRQIQTNKITEEKKNKLEEYEQLKTSIGVPCKTIKLSQSDMNNLIFFHNERILLYGFLTIKYDDILRYDISVTTAVKRDSNLIHSPKNDSSVTIKTSTSSLVGRTVLGGILLGGVGAVIGAVTAKKQVESLSYTPNNNSPKAEEHFSVYLRLKNGSEINIRFHQNKNKMEEFIRDLDYIKDLTTENSLN
jgi:hypothetical protein